MSLGSIIGLGTLSPWFFLFSPSSPVRSPFETGTEAVGTTEANMNSTPPWRRQFQFSLSTLFWLIVMAALAFYGVTEHRKRVRAEENAQYCLAALRDFKLEQDDIRAALEESNRLSEDLLKLGGRRRAAE
jgi:hypothetical protein